MKEILGYKAVIKGLVTAASISLAVFYARDKSIPLIQRIEPQSQSTSGDQLVVPFFPYTVTDSYSTQICVSNKPGRVLPPFIMSDTKQP